MDERTDRQMDRFAISILRVSILTCDKNYMALTDVFIFQPHLFSEINLPWETVKI